MKILLKEMRDIGLEAWVEGEDDALTEGLRLVPFGQGFKEMGPAVSALEQSVLKRRLAHGGHPVLIWCISNAIAVSDPAGWRKLDKSKSRFRIDGAVALAMALGLKAREGLVDAGPSVYESRGILSV